MSSQTKQILSLDAFILYALSNCQNLLACCSKFDHLVDGLLVSGEFPEQLSKKEVQLWIRETKAVNQENIPTICWKPWSTNTVASKALTSLRLLSSVKHLTLKKSVKYLQQTAARTSTSSLRSKTKKVLITSTRS